MGCTQQKYFSMAFTIDPIFFLEFFNCRQVLLKLLVELMTPAGRMKSTIEKWSIWHRKFCSDFANTVCLLDFKTRTRIDEHSFAPVSFSVVFIGYVGPSFFT